MSDPAFVVPSRLFGGPLPPRSRVLEPRRPGPNSVPTVYNQDGLIISAPDARSARDVASVLDRILLEAKCKLQGPTWLSGGRRWATLSETSQQLPDAYTAGVKLIPLPGQVGIPDPWLVLADLRAREDPLVARSVSLNHVLTSAELAGGNPFVFGHGRAGLDSYGIPGYGGRGPVTFVGPPPRPGSGNRRPRVVLLDTAVGYHPWFTIDPVFSSIRMNSGRVFGDEIYPYPRDGGRAVVQANPDRLVGTIGTRAGHGTFIAGLLRQVCPGVEIVALPVMGADGVVPEHMLIRALDLVLAKQIDEPGWADAVVLSLGYYNETPEDVEYSSGLKQLILGLAQSGVAVFAAAGNDATTRPSYPAAFAVDPAFDSPDVVPMVAVAALNPDGTPALFSNDGPWVKGEDLGVNLVSTAPALLDGSTGSAGISTDGRRRSALDVDNFRGGFESWSGTSFATPLLAGKYLRLLEKSGFPAGNGDRRKLLPIGRTKSAGPGNP